MALVGMGAEPRQYARAFRNLKQTDMLIVPGTGLLTDAWGLTSWGPYGLFKWSSMAKLRGCRGAVRQRRCRPDIQSTRAALGEVGSLSCRTTGHIETT